MLQVSAQPEGAWAWLDVMSGGRIETAGVDQFVPQMVNFELVGGELRHGLLPGAGNCGSQPIPGSRRAFVVHGAQAMAAGQRSLPAPILVSRLAWWSMQPRPGVMRGRRWSSSN